MSPTQPHRIDCGINNGPYSNFASSTPSELPVYPHTSTFRSSQMELQVNSPHVKIVQEQGENIRSLPIFREHDRVSGQVLLDASTPQPGRIQITIEGIFHYVAHADMQPGETRSASTKLRHIFFTSSVAIPILPGGTDAGSPRSTFREAIVRIGRPSLTHRPSNMSLSTPVLKAPFSFELPRGYQKGEDLPSSFSSQRIVESSSRANAFPDGPEISYRLTATWEANDSFENREVLETPILIQPDLDFQSLDALSQEPDSWLEMPLISDRPIPFQCAVTLPSSGYFSRSNVLPYFVIFTTNPRSRSLAREIATDATIAISLLQNVTITALSEIPPFLPTPPQTPPSSGEESDGPSPTIRTRQRFLKRVVKSASPILSRATPRSPEPTISEEPCTVPPNNKPLPRLPMEAVSTSRILKTDVFIGFPKRPRQRCAPQGHPSLDTHTSLPDGLLKGSIVLSKNMILTIDRPGMSVKYYLDVSVLFGQDDLRARIPIRLL